MRALVDIGANLAHESFAHDCAAVIQRARSSGVKRIIVTGSTIESSRQAVALARQHHHTLFATAGIHPHHAMDFDEHSGRTIGEMAVLPEVVAIGECGLDYYRHFSPRAAQLHAFAEQLAVAAICAKPVFLHQRDAHADFVAVLREHIQRLPGGVAHCFTGTRAQMDEYLGMGLSIGVTGWICDERRAADLRDAVAGLPLDRVMIESDAPYLLPRNTGRKPATRRNEPAYLPAVLLTTAHFMGVDAEELAAATSENAARLFGLPPPDAETG